MQVHHFQRGCSLTRVSVVDVAPYNSSAQAFRMVGASKKFVGAHGVEYTEPFKLGPLVGENGAINDALPDWNSWRNSVVQWHQFDIAAESRRVQIIDYRSTNYLYNETSWEKQVIQRKPVFLNTTHYLSLTMQA